MPEHDIRALLTANHDCAALAKRLNSDRRSGDRRAADRRAGDRRSQVGRRALAGGYGSRPGLASRLS